MPGSVVPLAMFCYKVTAVFVRGLFSKGGVRTEGEQPADQVSVNIINL